MRDLVFKNQVSIRNHNIKNTSVLHKMFMDTEIKDLDDLEAFLQKCEHYEAKAR